MIYFNEFESYPADWIRNLYPKGHVDERSICDVTPADVLGYERCHFFAGIGGWQYALELTGWPVGVPVWTGSCPCQPFSDAGKQQGDKDPRHLWPEFAALIGICKPPVIFGEQVASKIGRTWLDGVSLDLEEMGYAVGSADLCAAGINAPHIRQRLFWVAYGNGGRFEELEEPNCEQESGREIQQRLDINGCSGPGGMGDSFIARPQGHAGNVADRSEPRRQSAEQAGSIAKASPWADSKRVLCKDGKWRRLPDVEPSIQPLAYGIPRGLGKGRSKDQRMAISTARNCRVGQLKGYGNAIVPQLAAVFIRGFMEAIQEVKR